MSRRRRLPPSDTSPIDLFRRKFKTDPTPGLSCEIQRVHGLDTDELTELVDTHLRLNDKLRQDFGVLKIREMRVPRGPG